MAVTKKVTTKRKAAASSNVLPEETSSTSETTTSPKAVKIKKSYAMLIVAALVIAGLLYYFRSLFIVAIVNGQPITRASIVQQLEKQGGKQVLNIAVTKTLIEQEARKKNVSVSQKEIDAEMKKTETSLASQGQTLDQALAMQGLTRADYTDQVRLQLLIQKMVGKDITVSSKEVDDYIEANKSSFPENANMNELKKTVQEQLKQQKLNTKIQSWIETLQKNANITYFLNY